MNFPAAKGRQAHAVPEKEPKTHLINAMHRIHEDSVKVGYSHEGDSLKLLLTEWKDVEASQEKGGRESDAAFQSKNAASTAIEAILKIRMNRIIWNAIRLR